MKKLFILILAITLVFSFTGVLADTDSYSIETIEGVGYNPLTGDRDTTGYFTITNKIKLLDTSFTLDAVDNFDYIVFFNKNNQVIGFKTNETEYSPVVDDAFDLGSQVGTFVEAPEGAYSFSFQSIDWDRYISEVQDQERPNTYTITTDQSYTIDDMYDTVYTANGNEYSLFDMFEVSDIMDYNLIENGDFSDGTTGWAVSSSSGFSISVVNDALENVSTELYRYAYQDFAVVLGNEYYFKLDYKTTSVSNKIYFYQINSPNTYDTNGSNIWTTFSETIESNYTASDSRFTIRNYDPAVSTWYIDNVMVFDLTALTSAGDEPTAEQFEEIMKAWEWLNTEDHDLNIYSNVFCDAPCSSNSPDYEGFNDYVETNADQTYTSCLFTGYCYTLLNMNMFGAESDTIWMEYNEVLLDAGDTYFYYMEMDIQTPTATDVLTGARVGIQADTFYYNEDVDQWDLNNTRYPDSNGFRSIYGLIENEGSGSGVFRLELDYEYTGATSGNIDNSITHLWVFNASDFYGDANIPTAQEIHDFLKTIRDPVTKLAPSWIDPIELHYNYQAYEGLYRNDTSYTASDLESIVATYDFTPVVYERDVEDGADTYLTNLGINDATSKIILGVTLLLVITIIIAIVTKGNKGIILVVDVIVYLILSVMGWFAQWLAVIIGLAMVILIAITLIGGGSKDD